MNTVDRQLDLRPARNEAQSHWGEDSFSNATGQALIDQLNQQTANVNALKRKYEEAHGTWKNHRDNKVQGGHCARQYSLKKRRAECQAEQNRWLDIFASRMNAAKAAYDNGRSLLEDLKKRVEADAEAVKELASQGKTPDSVMAETQSQIREQEKASSQRRMITLGIVAAVVIVGGIIAVRAFKKK